MEKASLDILILNKSLVKYNLKTFAQAMKSIISTIMNQIEKYEN